MLQATKDTIENVVGKIQLFDNLIVSLGKTTKGGFKKAEELCDTLSNKKLVLVEELLRLLGE